uniref:Snake toxin/toxin-like domain-containing protein n=1 Tax=Sinocyclocheilus anshuiensis TaxID=1608454 RepID=A0A671LWA6_9TELE
FFVIVLYLSMYYTLFFSALTLKCYGCSPDSAEACTQTLTCPFRCGYMTTNIFVDGKNVGSNKAVTLNSQCCTTDYCNSPLNGKKCFTCSATTDCTHTLACEGDETQCFITTGEPFIISSSSSNTSMCFVAYRQNPYGFGAYMKCCEGNLCNGAQNLSVYFLMLVPLLSLFVF